MRFWLAGLVGIIFAGVLVAVGTVDRETAEREVGVAEEAAKPELPPSICQLYGEMTDRIVEARFPEPKADPKASILAEDGGYTGVRIPWGATIPNVSWRCRGKQLSVRVMGPWIFDSADFPSALENLLQNLRHVGLKPQDDAVSIVLDAFLVDGSARFDPAGVR